MNEVVKVLQNHATVRKFDADYAISNEVKAEIIKASKQAPSWMNGQAYSILTFQEEDEKRKLVEILSQDQENISNAKIIESSSLFLLFCIDFSRYGLENARDSFENELEPLIIGTMDASLALENALIAAESFDLGTCVIGGLRRVSTEIIDSFGINEYIFPLVGLAIGSPLKKAVPKPRLSVESTVFSGSNAHKTASNEEIKEYEHQLQVYAKENGYMSEPWLSRFKNYYKEQNYPAKTVEGLKKQRLI
ncbi:nitroreductase family protein [Enterococcus crotali]|uniref:nitroreductase family protein n=1 Tax=Enterococcus crotali TaxID=1453587 RepID=UPI00046E6198|nr:nitroreductase family protein [Enterococcus crotali]